MGNAVSQLRLAIREFLDILHEYNGLSKRIQQSPKLPGPNPSRSFWMAPESSIAKHRSSTTLPEYADVVIIGSGITGASVARALFDDADGAKLNVVMLEARDTCSGATGRNGGHITPPLYLDYADIRKSLGASAAQKLIRFRLAHIEELARISLVEDPDNYCEYRSTEASDVFYDARTFAEAKGLLDIYTRDMPEEGAKFAAYESADAAKKFNLAASVQGCITTSAGAINPYRFVTAILARLLGTFPKFKLYTNTACTSIRPPSGPNELYTISTPSGDISTAHVIHATNAHTSTLLEPLRGKVIPIRGTMSAQRPGTALTHPSAEPGSRSFIFYEDTLTTGYDYLTQLPSGEHEMMLGAAFAKSVFEEAGNTDDSTYGRRISAHLSGVLSTYFGERNWGAEKQPPDEEDEEGWHKGRVKALWSGILGISADARPWVGRLTPKLSGRRAPSPSLAPSRLSLGADAKEGRSSTSSSAPLVSKKQQSKASASPLTAPPGEWLSAGYTGEGMVHAWLCGKALACMVLDKEKEYLLQDWFPESLRLTEKRWKKAKIEDLLK